MSLLYTLLEISIYSGVLFIFIMLIKKIFKNKMSPFLHYVIWGLFLLRLIMPFTVDAPVHILTYPAQMPSALQTDMIISADNSFASNIPYTDLSDTLADNGQAEPPQSPAQPGAAPALQQTKLSETQIVLAVWLGTALLCLTYISAVACLLFRRIKRHSAPASAYLLRLLDDVKTELGIKSKLKLVCQYGYGSPALLFPRTILIHMDTLAALDDDRIKDCLRHECMHFKRGDHIVNLALTLLNCVYWFNPFIWFAFYEIRKDLEVFCDSAVVRHMSPSARHDYAMLILDLSAQARHMQIALGMVRNKKAAMRRIKGIFMEQKSKRSVKLVSATLAMLLTICCFTTACQPTPELSAVVNKADGITEDMIAEPSAENRLELADLPDHWTETLYRQNNKAEIKADTDVVIPENLSDIPILKLEQIPLTPERLTELTDYFAGGSKFYKPLTMTTFDGAIQLEKIKKGEGGFGLYSNSDRKRMEDKLNELIEQAPDNAQKAYTDDFSFSMPYQSEFNSMMDYYIEPYKAFLGDIGNAYSKPQKENYVDVCVETGEEYEPKISASTYDSPVAIPSSFLFSYPGRIMTQSDLEPYQNSTIHDQYATMKDYANTEIQYYKDFSKIIGGITETPEEALSTAQKAITELGIEGMALNQIEKGVWVPQQPQQWDKLSSEVSDLQGGYDMTFTRSANQLVGCRLTYAGASVGSLPQYTPPFRVEFIHIFVVNGKIMMFDWQSMAHVVETVAENSNLLPFDQIKSRLADYLSYQIEDPAIKTYHFDVTDAQLRAAQVPAKDDPYKAWFVPSWLFVYHTTYVDKNGKETHNTDSYCEINALDGGLIIPFRLSGE